MAGASSPATQQFPAPVNPVKRQPLGAIAPRGSANDVLAGRNSPKAQTPRFERNHSARNLGSASADSSPASNRRPGHSARPVLLVGPGTPLATQKFNLSTNRQRVNAYDAKYNEIISKCGTIQINGKKEKIKMDDLRLHSELGFGTCGHVVEMQFKDNRFAVKQMRRSSDDTENKRILMDLDVVMKCDCPYIVRCVGALIDESDVWICMELMDTCFDKLLKRIHGPIPQTIIGKVTVAVVKALNYLKEKHDVIHRDIKPSNILLDKSGSVRLCDFGISGRLVDSKVKTRGAGCAVYMAPERIEPQRSNEEYDIRADVWSLGITLVELATGHPPFGDSKSEFEVLSRIVNEPPPRLPKDVPFDKDFRDLVTKCLQRDFEQRPKYHDLLNHPFITRHQHDNRDSEVANWFRSVPTETVTQKQRKSGRQRSATTDKISSNATLTRSTTGQHPLPPPFQPTQLVSGVAGSKGHHFQPQAAPNGSHIPVFSSNHHQHSYTCPATTTATAATTRSSHFMPTHTTAHDRRTPPAIPPRRGEHLNSSNSPQKVAISTGPSSTATDLSSSSRTAPHTTTAGSSSPRYGPSEIQRFGNSPTTIGGSSNRRPVDLTRPYILSYSATNPFCTPSPSGSESSDLFSITPTSTPTPNEQSPPPPPTQVPATTTSTPSTFVSRKTIHMSQQHQNSNFSSPAHHFY